MRKIKRLILQTERRRQATNHKFKQSSESPAWNLQVVCFVQFTEIFNDRKIRKAKSKCLALDWWLIHYPQYLLIDLFVHSEKSSPSFCLYADSPPTVLVLVSWVFVTFQLFDSFVLKPLKQCIASLKNLRNLYQLINKQKLVAEML